MSRFSRNAMQQHATIRKRRVNGTDCGPDRGYSMGATTGGIGGGEEFGRTPQLLRRPSFLVGVTDCTKLGIPV